MGTNRKKKLLDIFRGSLNESRLTTSYDDSLICPLCWTEVRYSDLTLEHIVPESVGGRLTTISCARCNSKFGTELDAHLAHFQNVHDTFHGTGFLRGTVRVNEARMAMNFEWHSRNIRIVGEASDPRALDKALEEFRQCRAHQLNLQLCFGYNPRKMKIALLRIAYLALFHHFGYRYVCTPLLQSIRRQVSDPDSRTVDFHGLVATLESCEIPIDRSCFAIPGHLGHIPFLQVIIRCCKLTTSYHSVFMPQPGGEDESFFKVFLEFSQANKKLTLSSKHVRYLPL